MKIRYHKVEKIKHILFLILLFCSVEVFAQENPMSFSMEYLPNVSKFGELNSDSNLLDPKFKLSHNLNLKSEYFVSEGLSLVAGIGFMNTGNRYREQGTITDVLGNVTVFETIQIFNINYITLDIGNKFYINQFYIAPEFGLGFQMNSIVKMERIDSDGKKEVISSNNMKNSKKLSVSAISLSLSLGYEVALKNHIGLVGLKAYYLPKENSSNVSFEDFNIYGFGLFVGFKFKA